MSKFAPCALVAFSASFLLAASAQAAPTQWTVASGGNDHYYQRIDSGPITYDAALSAAAALTFNGLPGHLAILDTSDYAAERDFLFTNIYSPGVSSGRSYWLGATTPSEGQPWTWLDGSTVPTSITNSWNIDFNEGNVREAATFFQTNSDTVWDYAANDSGNLASGYLVEFEPPLAPEPASLTLLAAAIPLLLRRRKNPPQI